MKDFSSWKHIDDLDNEFNSHISDKGIPGVNDTNTNTDIKCKKATHSEESNDDDKLRNLPNLEDVVQTVDDDEYKDIPGLREQGIDDNEKDEEDYTYKNNKGILV